MVNHLLAEDAPPQVLTTSYAFNEEGLDAGSANTLCNAYAQLGARGVSIFFASGDGGVSGVQSQSCTSMFCLLYCRKTPFDISPSRLHSYLPEYLPIVSAQRNDLC